MSVSSLNYDGNYYLIYANQEHDNMDIATSSLFRNAKVMIEKAKITNYIDEAKALYSVLESLGYYEGKENEEDWVTLEHILARFHNLLVDEVFIISALEMYCSATLIEKGIIAHAIGQNHLKKEQKKRPIYSYELDVIDSSTVKDITLNLRMLLENEEYFKLLGLNDSCTYLSMLEKRNELHFHLINHKRIEKSYLEGVFNLYENILDKSGAYDDWPLKDSKVRQKTHRLSNNKEFSL